MIYKNEDGNYHIRILMLQEQCKQLKLAYPLEVDVCVCEAERSKEWEESIREKIEDFLKREKEYDPDQLTKRRYQRFRKY